jgi:DNA-binding transcriptional ArsR family regulator
VRLLAALANPHRLRILAALVGGRTYVSQLAREVRLSRPLVHMHLQRLEAAGLVSGSLELSEEGKAMKFFEATPFLLRLTPQLVAEAVETLSESEVER